VFREMNALSNWLDHLACPSGQELPIYESGNIMKRIKMVPAAEESVAFTSHGGPGRTLECSLM
jgi:hypothetical protein